MSCLKDHLPLWNDDWAELRLWQAGDILAIASDTGDTRQEIPNSLFKLHTVANVIIDYIESVARPVLVVPYNDGECVAGQVCVENSVLFWKDVRFLIALTKEGWQALESYDRILTQVAGGPVDACGVVGKNGHDLVLRVANEVLNHLPRGDTTVSPPRHGAYSGSDCLHAGCLRTYFNEWKLEEAAEEFALCANMSETTAS